MRLAFLLLLLLPLSSAAQAPLEEFLSDSFEPGQNVQTTPLQSGGSYIIISADGKETYAFDLQSGKALSDRPAIEALLSADAKNRTGFDAKLSLALGFAANVSSAKEYDEEKCMQYTGTDMHECFDKDSCILACFAVPLCSTPLYSDGFWEAILDWTNARKDFDSLLSSYSSGLEAIGTDAAAIDAKLSALDSLSERSLNISRNPLFLNRTDEGCSGSNATARCFEFCPKIDYSHARIAAQKQNLQSLKTALAQVQLQPARVLAISENGRLNDEYLATRGSMWEEFRLQMYNSMWKLSGRASELSKNVTDPRIAPLLEELSNLSSSITAKADAGQYRAALAQQEEFERLQAELSGRMDSDAKTHSDMLAALAAALQKTNKAEKVIGKESADYYREDIAAINATLFSSPTFGEIGEAKQKLDTLNEVLTAEIAAKALGEEAPQEEGAQAGANASQILASQQNQSKPSPYPQPMKLPSLPCLPALALLLVTGAAFSRKSHTL